MYKMVGQEIKSSHSNALLKLLPWAMAKDKVKQQAGKLQVFDPQDQQANFISTSSNIRRWRRAANIIDKDHGI